MTEKQHISNLISGDDLTDAQIYELHQYHDDPSKNEKYDNVRRCCMAMMRVVIDNCPRCADRTRALNAIRDVRMLANSAIALDGL